MTRSVITRHPPTFIGRSPGSAWGGLVFVAAVAPDDSQDFRAQCLATFERIEMLLGNMNSSKRSMLSVAIHLSYLGDKAEFDRLWLEWIGDDPAFWPQRTCVGGALAARYLVELQVTAVDEALLDT